MKFKIFSIAAAAALMTGAASCSGYLDKEVDLTQQADNVFSDYDMTRGFLAHLYESLPDAFAPYNSGDLQNGSRDNMTDNSISYWSGHYYHSVVNDGFTANNHFYSTFYWNRNYPAIRGCNQFILNAKSSVIGNADKNGDDNRLYDRSIAEARVLRAIFHFDLASWFGDIPIVGDDEEGTPIILTPLPHFRAAHPVPTL